MSENVNIPLGTSIANVFARSPIATAAQTLTLHEATGGNFLLGIGASTPMLVEQFHGVEYDRPLRHIRETIEIVDLALSGEEIEYDGTIFTLNGFRLNHADSIKVPILNGAIGTTNIALSIEYADGILPHMLPLTALDDVIADAEGRVSKTSSLHVAPSMPTSVSEDPQEARYVLSKHVAYYIGSTKFYNKTVSENGFREEAVAVREAWEKRDREAAAAAVFDELLDALGIVGIPERAQRRLEELLNDIVDSVIISFPMDATQEMFNSTLQALPEGVIDG